MKQGGATESEKALAKAFKLLAEKVQDPKHKGRNEVQVWAQILTELAMELEHGCSREKSSS